MSKTWDVLYSKTASGKINYWQIWTEGAAIKTRWGTVGGEELSDQVLAEGKNIGRSNETSPEQQAELEAQSKYDKKLRLKYFTSIEDATGKLNLKPMLAGKLDDKRGKKLVFPVHIQPKLNGVRCIAYALEDGSVRLMSRGGKDYTLPHVQEELKGVLLPGQHLDGELYCHGMSLQTIVHHIKTYTNDSLCIRYCLYDMFHLDTLDTAIWRARFNALAEFCCATPWNYIDLVDTAEASSMEHIDKIHDRYVEDKYEGAIVRLMHGTYRIAARSLELLKYKKFLDGEFEVTGWRIGKHGVVVFECVQEEGKKFEVQPEGSAEERAQMLAEAPQRIGQLLTVRYKDRSDDNIPQHLVGVAFRGDEDL